MIELPHHAHVQDAPPGTITVYTSWRGRVEDERRITSITVLTPAPSSYASSRTSEEALVDVGGVVVVETGCDRMMLDGENSSKLHNPGLASFEQYIVHIDQPPRHKHVTARTTPSQIHLIKPTPFVGSLQIPVHVQLRFPPRLRRSTHPRPSPTVRYSGPAQSSPVLPAGNTYPSQSQLTRLVRFSPTICFQITRGCRR